MSLRLLGPTGIQVSPLCLGTMNFGNPRWGCDEDTSRDILHHFAERGGNFLDTANTYAGGRSEEILGRWLEGRRDSMILATKGFFPMEQGPNAMGNSRRNLRRQLEDSLRRLQVECVDLYQIHMWDPITPIDETLSVLSDFVHEGKTHYVGACNLTGWQLAAFMERAEANGFERFVSIQPQYNLVCRDIESEVMPCADHYDLGILAWSPLAFGLLSGKYSREGKAERDARMADPEPEDIMHAWKQRTFTDRNLTIAERLRELATEAGTSSVALAIRWVLEQPSISAAIIGPRSVEQLEENWAALEFEFEPELFEKLEKISEPEPDYLEYMQGKVTERRVAELE